MVTLMMVMMIVMMPCRDREGSKENPQAAAGAGDGTSGRPNKESEAVAPLLPSFREKVSSERLEGVMFDIDIISFVFSSLPTRRR